MNLDTVLRVLAVLLLVLANGFFVAAEFSLVATRRSRVQQLVEAGHPLAPAVKRGVENLDAYLAACQLGITMASLALGWIGEPALATVLEPAFAFLPPEWALVSAHALAIAVAFTIITTLHIVLGELAPKSLALQRTEGTALAVAAPLGVFLTIFHPAIFILNGMGNLALRLVGLQPARGEELVHTAEELRYLVTASRKAGVLDEVEGEMAARIFEFGETRAHEVMVPRTEIVAVEAEASLEETLEQMARAGHTRLPVYEDDLDHVAGVGHLRDLVRALRDGVDPTSPVRALMRRALVVPESASIEDILAEMRRRRTQMAIVIDEHGGTAGLVTMENLLEEIVGEVQDEFERPHEIFRPQPDGTVVVDGLVSTEEFGERFGLELPDEEGYNTLGGLVMAKLGRIPRVGDQVLLDGYGVEVESLDGRRVATVRVFKR